MNEQSLSLITTGGENITIEYEIEEGADDYIFDEIRDAIINDSMLCLEGMSDDVTIKIGEHFISELDCKKIIGIDWY